MNPIDMTRLIGLLAWYQAKHGCKTTLYVGDIVLFSAWYPDQAPDAEDTIYNSFGEFIAAIEKTMEADPKI